MNGNSMNVGRWVSWWSRIAGQAPAIVFDGDTYTYRDMDRRINKIAHALSRAGVSHGDRVAVLLGNCPEYLETFFACAKIGAVFVPLNVRLAGKELAYIVGHAEPSALLSESAFDDVLGAVSDETDVPTYVSLDAGTVGADWAEFLADASDEDPTTAGASWDDNLAICYTSGTTGLPKGALLTHGNLLYSTLQMIVCYGFDQRDTHLMHLPLCFTGGLLPASMPVFHSGGTMVLERQFMPSKALDNIEQHRISAMMGVPTMYQLMQQEPSFPDRDLSSLRIAMSGGAPVPVPLIEVYQQRGVPFTNGYGITEATGYNMYLPSKDVITRSGAYLPAMYNEVKVVDPHGNPAAPDVPGELLIRGPLTLKEYWRDPDATAAAYTDDWFHTGDVARVDEDGYLYVVDRMKDMVISGGLNVYPAEVENVLFKDQRVSDVAVAGLDHPKWGEAVVAFIVPKAGESLSEEELASVCAENLADYKRPQKFLFVDAIPRNVSGKVLKRELRTEYADLFFNEVSGAT